MNNKSKNTNGLYQLQQEADKAQPKKRHSVGIYVAVLFAVAFFLLLLSYLMQQRNNAELINGLRDSVSAVESLQQLQDNNSTLQVQVEQLEEQAIILQSDLASAKDTLEASQKKLEATDLLWQISKLYSTRRYTVCREAIAKMEELELKQYLSETCINSFQSESPLSEYERIVKALN